MSYKHYESERETAAGISEPTSNVGKWDEWYKGLKPDEAGFCYGDTLTYLMAASFLADVSEVEDWGCGAGGFKRFCRTRYVGVDGSATCFAERKVDLCAYTSRVEGILMRHVLEHNYQWEKILENALRSFTRKMCLVLFTPFTAITREIAHNCSQGIDVPDLSFCRKDIERRLDGVRWSVFENLVTETQYETEHVYLIWREQPSTPIRNSIRRLVRHGSSILSRRANAEGN